MRGVYGERARAAGRGPSWRAERGKGEDCFLSCKNHDLERVRAALRVGAQPQQVYSIDGCTKRAKQPDTIAHGPDGDVLILVRLMRDHAGAPVGRGKGRARQEQEPMRSRKGEAGPLRKQTRLNGLMLPLRRGNATEPCAQVVR